MHHGKFFSPPPHAITHYNLFRETYHIFDIVLAKLEVNTTALINIDKSLVKVC